MKLSPLSTKRSRISTTRSRISTTLGLALAAGIAASSATADDSGWYGGANIGQSRATIDGEGIAENLRESGLNPVSMTEDERDLGFKLFGGYQFNRNFALEGGYHDLGQFDFTTTTEPPGTLNGTTKIRGINLDAVGILPFTEKLSAFGRAGLNYAEARDSFSSTGLVSTPDDNSKKRDMNYKFGLGLQYALNESFDVRAEAERYRIDDAVGNRGDIDLFSVGLVYRFGGNKSAPDSRAAAPAPTQAAVVAGKPAMVIVPVPAQTEEYCSILDVQFEIDQDEIQQAEKEKLSVVGTFLKKYPKTTAVIEAHTDNVGTSEHNMELSQRRAENVVSHLVDNYQIDPSRLQAVGLGDTRPIADNSSDEGKRMNRRTGAVIACATDIEGLKPIPARITMALLMEFDRDMADIRPQYRDGLRKVADFLKAHPDVTATVEGHTGNASPDLAMELSQRRAQNVVNYLVDNLGVARSRLTAEGFGETRRFAYNTSAEGRQDNRRVNVIFNYPKQK